jgi:hypothetical protein
MVNLKKKLLKLYKSCKHITSLFYNITKILANMEVRPMRMRIWSTLMSTCLFIDIPSEWEKVLTWSIATLQGKGLQASLGKLCLGACIYHLWQQRNVLVHNSNLRTEETMVKQITWKVCTRILAKGSFKNLDKCIELVIS